ncbi:MAG: GNAT family N-acetyltransferase [Planctomycetes bacterium]|nr:GNAT family N-acetyltransferase [Planctomycetota bacterium]
MSAPRWEVAPATVADIPELMRVRHSVRENRLSDPSKVSPDDVREMLERRGHGWVVRDGERVLGFAIADRLAANIWALFVEPDAEGRGIGRALHDTMLAWLAANACDAVTLTTAPGTRAERFYRVAGWRCTGTTASGELAFVRPTR